MQLVNVFWLVAGAMLALCCTWVLRHLWGTARGLHRATLAAAAGIFSSVSVALYLWLGSPQMLSAQRAGPAAAADHLIQQASAPLSLEAATARLAQRLEQHGGADEDWQLLAQSYEQQGDQAAAEAARAQRIVAQAPPAGSGPPPQPAAGPDDAAAWLSAARTARTARRYAEAAAAFERVIGLQRMDADAWADYADVLATRADSLRGAPAAALTKALALDARHKKALWLNASLALEERRYQHALDGWIQLRRLIADASPDARIIDSNIAEARTLVKQAPRDASADTAVRARTPVRITGTVQLDAALQAAATAGMTLFIYAKAVGSPGAPLAVLRTQPQRWPVQFELDDTLAMVPDRKLSGFERVVIEARLSRSGQAGAQPGDLQGTSEVMPTARSQPVKLQINKRIS